MNLKEQSEIFKKVLKLKYEAIAIIFTNDQVCTGKYEKHTFAKQLN